MQRFIGFILILLMMSCNSELIVELSDTDSYTINYDGASVYGTLDSPWTPTSSDWEIEIALIWDSSVGGNVYPLASNSGATSIYIDSGGLPLFKYENSYITSNISRFEDGILAKVKFVVSATNVDCYFNDVLEKSVATTKTLTVPWSVVGAHASYSSKFKGQIRSLKLTDLLDSSNTKEMNFVYSNYDTGVKSQTQEEIRAESGVDFTLSSSNAFTDI